MNILARAPYRGMTGYATMNRNILIELAKMGHRIYLEPIYWASNNVPATSEEEAFMAFMERNGYMNIPSYEDITTLHLTMPEIYNYKLRGKNIGWYIFEADRVPERWKNFILYTDEIMTPTQFNAEQVRAIGYDKPIHIMHCGVNPKIYNLEVEPLLKKDNKFTFLSVGVAHERKRWKETISCYLEEFSGEPVRLIMKLEPTRHATAIEIEQHIRAEKARTGSDADVMLYTKAFCGSLAPLYASADCFVSVAGEGWCLPASESVACGCYSVLIDWGGFTEWHTSEMGLKVKVKELVKCDNMEGFSGYEDSSLRWAYPDLDDFRKQMRKAYDDREMIKSTRKERSELMHAKYNWQKTVRQGISPLMLEKQPVIAHNTPKLSIAMITKNEAGFLVDGCNVFKSNLAILSKFADEIVVVDGNSIDETVKIAESFGAKVYQYDKCKQKCEVCGKHTPENVCDIKTREEKDCFSKFRRASFRLCTGDWIWRMDADELIREEDISMYRNLINGAYKDFHKYIAFVFPTLNFWKQLPYYRAGHDGRFSWFPDNHVRLYRNIPETHQFFAPAHEGVNVPTEGGWINLIQHKQSLFLGNPMVFHYGYLKSGFLKNNSIERNERYKKLGARTHYLGNENVYSLSTVKWEGNVPALKYKETDRDEKDKSVLRNG